MAVPPDYSLAPIGPPYEQVLALVSELRSRLASTLPPGAVLWGGELLNGEDAAGMHLLAKCATAQRRPRQALTLSAPSAPLRFIRARDLDLDKAQSMVQHTLEWRKTYGADAIAADNSIPACLDSVAKLAVRAPAPAGARSRSLPQGALARAR